MNRIHITIAEMGALSPDPLKVHFLASLATEGHAREMYFASGIFNSLNDAERKVALDEVVRDLGIGIRDHFLVDY